MNNHLKAPFVSLLVLGFFALLAGGSVDETVTQKHAYDFTWKWSHRRMSSSYVELQFRLEISNLSDSASMKIGGGNARASYFIDGNEYRMYVPKDADGNSIEAWIAPGASKTVFFEDIRQGRVPDQISFAYHHGAGWVKRDR